MKYIMFEIEMEELKRFVPIIFPKLMVHKIVAQGFIPILRKHNWAGKIRSAGELHYDQFGDVICSGGSETLNTIYHEDDAKIISTYDYTFGII
jgi:hypothetical protein